MVDGVIGHRLRIAGGDDVGIVQAQQLVAHGGVRHGHVVKSVLSHDFLLHRHQSPFLFCLNRFQNVINSSDFLWNRLKFPAILKAIGTA